MAEHIRSDSFTFDEDEIAVLLGIVGGYSPALVAQMGLDVDAFERVYESLAGAAYGAMHEDHPRVVTLADLTRREARSPAGEGSSKTPASTVTPDTGEE